MKLRWLPTTGWVPWSSGIGSHLTHLIMPVSTLTAFYFGSFSLVYKAEYRAISQQLFVKVARAKGLGEVAISFKHILPNAVLPVITYAGLSLGQLVGGAVVTESVFSVHGDLAPLAELHGVCRRHGALLVVDEAHALGVIGPGGRGAVCAAGLAGQPDVIQAMTLSKSLAAQGGAVLGAPEVIQTLVDTGRSFIFDTGLAPPCAGAAKAALDVLAADPGLGSRCRQNAARIATIAAECGLEASAPAAGVVSIVLGRPQTALAARRSCAEHGVRVGCFRPPSVPAGRSCLRLAAHATLTQRDFTVVSRALAAVRDDVYTRDLAGRRWP